MARNIHIFLRLKLSLGISNFLHHNKTSKYLFLVISYHHLTTYFCQKKPFRSERSCYRDKNDTFHSPKNILKCKKIKIQQFSTLLSAKITLTKCVWRAIKETKHEILFCIINFGMINLITHEHDEIIHHGYRVIKKSNTNLINFDNLNKIN